MKPMKLLALVFAAAALGAAPAFALPSQASEHASSHANSNASSAPTVETNTTLTNNSTPPSPPNEHAYGVACREAKESKQHVAGQKGTPFSQCVVAMAQLHNGTAKNPVAACKKLSKKHVAGQKGTPFSQCVVAAAKMKAHEHK